ncbi:hypothetical protein ACJIZ3_013696 [Penstemon smallii]|uniref:Uncharacterized protein n=1 Tax=Penstemon smallii TaxID=265156 RepID=A0ABD3RHR3_9LAMI
MLSFGRKQIRAPKNKAKEYELVPQFEATEKKAVRKIYRCPVKVKVKEIITGQTTAPGDNNSGQSQTIPSAGDTNSGQTSDGDLDESLARFGPFYGTDLDAISATKKIAWQHVKKSTSKDDPGATKEMFASAIRRVEKEAKETYNEKIAEAAGTNSKFRLMMVKDGCFFLQLAFLILGKSGELGYSENDLIFGKKLNKKDIRKWIESMFFVGNQIPLVVLKELLNEKFFQEVISKGNWDHQPTSSLCKKVLYELLVLPHLNKNYPEDDFDIDIEANTLIVNGENTTSGGNVFPCAIALKQAGIHIKKLKSTTAGIRSIHFESYYFWANIYMPVLPVDDGVDILFRNLKTYDQITQQNHEVSSYLRLMSDIIQTTQDVKLLKKKGIIQGSNDDAEKLPRILSRLSSEDIKLTHEFHNLRRKIRDYSSPWIHYQGILNFVAFLTLLQTFFTLLAYFKPPKQ